MRFTFFEDYTEGWGAYFRIKKFLYTGQSQYQSIDVFESYDHGKILVLDGAVMLTERDEFAYHEMIVHVPLFSHPNPERVLVIGGGDGGTIREILKHKEVKEAILVEIDEEVIKISEEFFPELTASLKDPRCKVLIEDGIKFIKECKPESFDVIIVDSTDPIGPAVGLFESEFYHSCYRALKSDGILNVQSGSPYFQLELIKKVNTAIGSHFPIVRTYIAGVPMYGGLWSFTIGSKYYDPKAGPVKEDFDIIKDLKYYNYEVHKGAFAIPNYIKRGAR